MSAAQNPPTQPTSVELVRDFLKTLPADRHFVVTTWGTSERDVLRETIADLRECAADPDYDRITVLILLDKVQP